MATPTHRAPELASSFREAGLKLDGRIQGRHRTFPEGREGMGWGRRRTWRAVQSQARCRESQRAGTFSFTLVMVVCSARGLV